MGRPTWSRGMGSAVETHLVLLERIRGEIGDTIARFNARDVEGVLAKHAEDIRFALPMLGGRHDAVGGWGRGRAAFREDAHLGFERQGALMPLDLVPAKSHVGLLMVDTRSSGSF